jgi:hypothetical protein
MLSMRARHLRSVPDPDENHKAVVSTDEDEQVEFDGCSDEEVRAKLRDFYAWAS